jgi:hypothetical protein
MSSTPQPYVGLKREITGPSGRKFNWHRPPRHIFWKHGKASLTFSARVSVMFEGITERLLAGEDEEQVRAEEAARLYEGMTDEQRIGCQAFVDDVIANSVDLEPGEAPNDLRDNDYWYIYNLTTYGEKTAPIQTKEGETTAEVVETFPEQPGILQDSASMSDVRAASGAGDGNS